jgi:hypothetical protein
MAIFARLSPFGLSFSSSFSPPPCRLSQAAGGFLPGRPPRPRTELCPGPLRPRELCMNGRDGHHGRRPPQTQPHGARRSPRAVAATTTRNVCENAAVPRKSERDDFPQPSAHPPHLAVQHPVGGPTNPDLSSSFSSSIPYCPSRGNRGISSARMPAVQGGRGKLVCPCSKWGSKKRTKHGRAELAHATPDDHSGALPPPTTGAGRGFST